MRGTSTLVLVVGLVLVAIGGAWIVLQHSSGAQPWGPLLSDNVLFAKSLPFLIGLGILLGLAQALGGNGFRAERRGERVRRFSVATALSHWTMTLGFLLAFATGLTEYLKGVLDVPPPLPSYILYRVHYIGASLVVLTASSLATSWLLSGDRRLLPDLKRFARELRGLAAELPRPLGSVVAGFFGLSMRRPAPPVGQFTSYERLVSFPIWVVLVGLIVLTGLVKAMRYLFPIPGELVSVASVVHVATMVMLAAKLLDHLRYVLSPSRWPLFVAMVTTWMGVKYARARHPGWAIGDEALAAEPSLASKVVAEPADAH
ncbi:MAG: cytochrome b/b6 domain-containing protein [Planctomycetes bacterium]|nr:cytochrome b/b6 domain-containing protein [Planctomycetota bacterium]